MGTRELWFNFTPTTVSKLLTENKEGKECHNPPSFVDFFPENDEKDIYSHDFSPKMMKKIFILTIFIVLHP